MAEIVAEVSSSAFLGLIHSFRYLSVIALLALFLIQFLRLSERGLIAEGFDRTTTFAVAKIARLCVLISALLMVLQTTGVSISGLLAFGGVSGIAVGFAAKDLLANFFGGLMIYLDRPFSPGDWIRSPDREIEGTVEKIGWRLTMIRTFDARPLYVPNSIFSTIAVENPSRMSHRRIYETIGVRYCDVNKVKSIVDEVRSMLVQHEAIDVDKTLIVNLNSFAPSSLDFFVYAFTKTTSWVEFHGIKQAILLRINDVVAAHGAEIAFPTATLHLSPIEANGR
ncbi:MAG: mechanosensitive ion channel family protein [Pseudomonadales bacterium]|nr:mechanosensitive ion channel family protein [Pseudomonadales bacterium]